MNPKKATFLLAMPSLQDGIFTKAVVLMANHDEGGALGFIINRTTGADLAEALKLLELPGLQKIQVPILLGGPVQTDFFWVIHSPDVTLTTTIATKPQYAISSALEIFPLLGTQSCPTIYFAGVGYAGWSAQQLEREIAEGAWWMDEIDPKLIFPAPPQEKWHEAFKVLGIETGELVDTTDPFTPPVIN